MQLPDFLRPTPDVRITIRGEHRALVARAITSSVQIADAIAKAGAPDLAQQAEAAFDMLRTLAREITPEGDGT